LDKSDEKLKNNGELVNKPKIKRFSPHESISDESKSDRGATAQTLKDGTMTRRHSRMKTEYYRKEDTLQERPGQIRHLQKRKNLGEDYPGNEGGKMNLEIS